MELFVVRFYFAKDGDCLDYIGGGDGYLLETAVKGSVLFYDFCKFVHGCCADALDFSSGKGWLKHVGGVQAALSPAGADDGMEFIDEKNQVRV